MPSTFIRRVPCHPGIAIHSRYVADPRELGAPFGSNRPVRAQAMRLATSGAGLREAMEQNGWASRLALGRPPISVVKIARQPLQHRNGSCRSSGRLSKSAPSSTPHLLLALQNGQLSPATGALVIGQIHHHLGLDLGLGKAETRDGAGWPWFAIELKVMAKSPTDVSGTGPPPASTLHTVVPDNATEVSPPRWCYDQTREEPTCSFH